MWKGGDSEETGGRGAIRIFEATGVVALHRHTIKHPQKHANDVVSFHLNELFYCCVPMGEGRGGGEIANACLHEEVDRG